jgi:hypothetical protein
MPNIAAIMGGQRSPRFAAPARSRKGLMAGKIAA